MSALVQRVGATDTAAAWCRSRERDSRPDDVVGRFGAPIAGSEFSVVFDGGECHEGVVDRAAGDSELAYDDGYQQRRMRSLLARP
jgi:hypothetical protein